jgi:hypothetical protein
LGRAGGIDTASIASINPDAHDGKPSNGSKDTRQKYLEEVAEHVKGTPGGSSILSATGNASDSHSGLKCGATGSGSLDMTLLGGASRSNRNGGPLSDAAWSSHLEDMRMRDGEKRNADGTVTRTRDDGAECTYRKVKDKNGSEAERLETSVKDGKTRTFKYDNAGDPTFVTGFTDRLKTSYGKGGVLEEKFVRVNGTNEFVGTQADGHTFRMDDVRIEKDGRVSYLRKPEDDLDETLDKIFGRGRLNSGDLSASKQRLLAAGSHLFGGHLEAHLDKIINRLQHNKEHGIKQPTNDEIAKLFDYIRAPLESDGNRHGAAARLSHEKIKSLTEEFVTIWENPEDKNRQAQIGSCYLQAIHFIPEKAGSWQLAKAWSEALIDGKTLGKRFTDVDYSRVSGQSPANHVLNSIYAKVIGYDHVTGGYPGTATFQAQKAFQALFGAKFPVFTLGARISEAALRGAIAKYGAVACITMRGAHAQAVTLNDAGQFVLANWWYNGDDRILSRRELNLYA